MNKIEAIENIGNPVTVWDASTESNIVGLLQEVHADTGMILVLRDNGTEILVPLAQAYIEADILDDELPGFEEAPYDMFDELDYDDDD